MIEKNSINFQTEGASEKRSFAFERGPSVTLKTHEKQLLFFIYMVFSKSSLEKLFDLRMIE